MEKSNYERLSDFELIKLINSKGKSKLFGLLYDRYATKVFNKSMFLIKDHHISEDLTHDIFLKAFLNLKGFQFKASFLTWMLTITYNYCINYLKTNKNAFIIYDNEIIENTDIMDDDSEQVFKIAPDKLKQFLEQIQVEEKIILLMKYQDDLSLEEIAQSFKISLSATKMRIKRAKEKVIQLSKN